MNDVRNSGNLMPNDGFTEKDQLSDAFDGVDSLAHLTTITDPRADRVEWFACADATTTGAGVTSTNCQSIGTDTSGTQAVAPSGSNETFQAGSFEAYEFFWDIPGSLNNDDVTIVSRACNGAPSGDVQDSTDATQEGTPVNCRDAVELQVELDDASTSGTTPPGTTPPLGQDGRQLPTGEITGICTGTADACLPVGATGTSTGTGTYSAFNHGSALPTTDFTLRYRTSNEVTGAGACIAPIAGSPTTDNAKNDPSACNTFPSATVKTDVNTSGTDNQTTYNEFSSRFTGQTAPANSTFAHRDVAIYGQGGDDLSECEDGTFLTATTGSLNVTGQAVCVLDEHYAVAFEQGNAGLVLTFNNDESSSPAAGTTTCASPDTAETNRLGTTEVVTACLSDQTGSRTNATITFESTGVGTLTCTGGTGTGQTTTTPSTPSAGDTQRCTVTTANGRATATLTNSNTGTATPTSARQGTPGDQTVTACVDRTATTSNPVGCGTSDTPTSNAVVKTWMAVPSSANLVFQEADGTADCVNGDKFKVNRVGDNDTLVVCITDARGRTATTSGADSDTSANTYRLSWSTNSCNAVGFTSNPPQETDANGQASVEIRAIAQGTCSITVNMDTDGDGDADATSSVTKSVEGTQGQQPQCNDGVDNDGDGDIDHPNDAGCTDVNDNTENSEGTPGPIVESGPCTGYGQDSRTNLNTGGQIIVGTDGDDILDGTDGNDIICGLGGNDIISAGDGSDQVVGNAGEDIISGGAGKDTINGNRDDDTIDGKGGNDIIKGSKGDDTLRGNGGFDTIRGGGGNDTLQGGKGQDILRGGGGNDTLKGFTGNDILNGGPGTDTCNPGPGRDKVRNCER